ncbi:hypothetical protein J18TS1_27460 [Oceanobacillus oncorhynchi subsp. incaldanensis]|uniref:CapA family protein n=1 Tax=Oceanobacillus oncorhynchi TaxID=545501 RepID=UPI001B17DD8F|nr:CapA family protein [Oceanobacillus oncorhynchi]GIO19646.1 hypothetical protein J18TS1_27460 [Oceanobacillus oncorhynchi subsp. incaldanensis]
MEIIIGGDVVPTINNQQEFINGDIDSLLCQDLQKVWYTSDYRIFNLETPLLNQKCPIKKKGPNLIAPEETINGIKQLNPSLIMLANNHIFDQGKAGLNKTIQLLKENNIPYVGVGNSISEVSKSFIIKDNEVSIAFYNCAEHEYSIATEKSPGANPFDPLNSLDHISKLKQENDFLVVIYHGGKENYRYPTPYLRKVCRKIAEKGADAIICQHSHCIGAFEEYDESTIVYGQGNFLFNKYDNEYWNNGMLLKLKFNNKVSIDYIPYIKTKTGIKKTQEQEKQDIIRSFCKRSEDIKNDDFVEKEFEQLANDKIDNYLRSIGYGKWMARIDNRIFKGKLLKRKFSEEKMLTLENYIECEVHHELIVKGLKLRNRRH